MYYFQTGFIPLAQNKLFFDIFNAVGSGRNVQVTCITMQKNFAAVTGVAFQMNLQKTTSVGSGGSILTPLKLDSLTADVPSGITVRSAATGGAALGDLIKSVFLHSEETNQAAAIQEAFPLWPPPFPFFKWTASPVIREGEGLTLKQITNTVAGTYNVWVAFTA